jgi:hypothetical protein
MRSLVAVPSGSAVFESRGAGTAREFLKRWWKCTLRSRLEPVKKVARLIPRHQKLPLNWF